MRNEIGWLNYRRPIKFEPKGLRIELEILKGTEAAKFIKQLIGFFCLVGYATSYQVSATAISISLSCLNNKGFPCQYWTLFSLGHRIWYSKESYD